MTRYHIAVSVNWNSAELWVFDAEHGVVDFQSVTRVDWYEMRAWAIMHIEKWPGAQVCLDDNQMSRNFAEGLPMGAFVRFVHPIRYRELPYMIQTSESKGKKNE